MIHRYKHWTEDDPATRNFLEDFFGSKPEKLPYGPDFKIGDITVEVKATTEWQRTEHASGTRRRGRFCLHGYEQADFVCFVLIRKTGLEFLVMTYPCVVDEYGAVATINHAALFN